MTTIVGVFDGTRGALAAAELLDAAGLGGRYDALLTQAEARRHPRLKRRGETMLRAAVKWGILAAVIVELPSLVALLIVPWDLNVKILLAATVWKFGAGFGAWIGAMCAGENGLDDELAEHYETHLAQGRTLLAVNAPSKSRSGVRGILLESDSIALNDVRGTFMVSPRQKIGVVAIR